jgi:type IV pilus assembly protein PilV
LKHTDSALMASQASFIAYDMLDRLRASPRGAQQQDLTDFNHNVIRFGGETASGTVASNQGWVTITIVWDDARVANSSIPLRRFVLSSRVAAFP